MRLETLENRVLLAVSPLGADPLPASESASMMVADSTGIIDSAGGLISLCGTVLEAESGNSTFSCGAPLALSGSIDEGHSPVDLDGDGFIGPGDYSVLSSHWFASEGGESWDASCDIDGDGFIGSGDLSYISINWLKSVDDPEFVSPAAAEVLPGETISAAKAAETDPNPSSVQGEPEVFITLSAVSQPTEEVQTLKTGTRNFGTFYYLSNDDVPATTREAVVGSDSFYLEVWISDAAAEGKFISSIQVQLDYDPEQVVSLEVEDIYAGKYTLSEFQFYDTLQSCVKAFQVAWLFSESQDLSLLEPITGGENAWLLARFTVTVDTSLETTPPITVSGVTEPVSPFVSGYYYVRTGEPEPVDNSLIESAGVPAYSRLWAQTPDIDGNGVISTGDWALLLDAWNTSPGDEAWNENCDITGDKYIDGDDLIWLTDNWLETWP